MDKLTQFCNNIASYKPCSVSEIQEIMARAMMVAIVKELIRLGYSNYESVYFDDRKRRLRQMGDTVGVCYHRAGQSDCFHDIDINGQVYGLLEDFIMPEGDYNRNIIQSIHLDTLEKIYNYLRLERKSNSLRKRDLPQ